MEKIRRNCPDCGTELELTPMSAYYYCDKCNKAISLDHPKLVTEELFIKFDNMFDKCVELREDLDKNHNISVSDDKSSVTISWPRPEGNMLYKRHCTSVLGTGFKTKKGRFTTEEIEASHGYLTQIAKTKYFGSLLTIYAKKKDSLTSMGITPTEEPFMELVDKMRLLYDTTDCTKEIVSKKPRKVIKLSKRGIK